MTKLRALLAVLALSLALPAAADQVLYCPTAAAGSVPWDVTIDVGSRAAISIVWDNAANTAAAAVTLTLQAADGTTLLVLTPTQPTLSARTATLLGDVPSTAVAPVLNSYPLPTPPKLRIQWAASSDAVGLRRPCVLAASRY